MAERKTTRRKTPVLKVVKQHLDDTRVLITPVDVAETPRIAQALLTAAPSPGVIRTRTAPNGWVIPAEVADKLGL